MKRQHKFSSEEQEQLAQTEQNKSAPLLFSSAEELLRHDAKAVEAPPAVAQRLNASIQNQPKPATSWWRRFLGT
jgi:hypothetical protein